MLRASFRAVDRERSDRVTSGPETGAIWRPYSTFRNPKLVTPLAPTRYEIEIYPFGHVFRAGHELVLQLHAPPFNDPLSIGLYPPEQTPALVQTLASSSVLLPVLPVTPPAAAAPASCTEVAGELCLVAPR